MSSSSRIDSIEKIVQLKRSYASTALTCTSRLDRPQECPICYEADEELKAFSQCGHWVGEACFQSYFVESEMLRCPTCRSEKPVDHEYLCQLRVHRFIAEDEISLQTLPQEADYIYKPVVIEENVTSVMMDVVTALKLAKCTINDINNGSIECSEIFASPASERERRYLRRAVRRGNASRFVYEQYDKACKEGLACFRLVVKPVTSDLTYLSLSCFGIDYRGLL